jgi:Tol biopolymer transport system component
MVDVGIDLLAQSPTPVAYGLGALALLVSGIALFFALEGGYLLALGLYLAGHLLPGRQRLAAAALLAAFGLAGTTSALRAQQAERAVSTIEPRYTRIFSSDTMSVFFPALSPDGRWVAFTRMSSGGQADIWIASTSGGAPVALTSGRRFARSPVWFPGSDRIAYMSDFVMTIGIDPHTGQPLGPPSQVSLEGSSEPAVSPDGTRIAYVTIRDSAWTVDVIPATGGNAQRVAQFMSNRGLLVSLAWSPDGEYLYFARPQAGTRDRVIVRVPARGGRTEELGSVALGVQAISPTGALVLRSAQSGPGQAPVFELTTPGGRAVARFAMPRNMRPFTFTSDGRALLAVLNNSVGPIRVVPVAGGPARQLTEARENDWPLGWSADASQVFIETRMNGEAVVLSAPVDGGPATTSPVPSEARDPIQITHDGRYLFYAAAGADGEAGTLVVRRLADGSTREVTRNLFRFPTGSEGPVSPPVSLHDLFYYFERRGERFELRATPPEGAPRLLASFPLRLAGRTSFGVHQSRVAYTEARGDSTEVFLVEGAHGPPHRLLTWPGKLTGATWSRSGRWLAFDHYPPGDNPRHSVLVVGVGANGAVNGPPRVLESGAWVGWEIQWLPNDEALTVFGMTGSGIQTQVFLVPLREGERPVVITRDDPSVGWTYELSPDGRYVAYPAEIPRGSSIWRVDLGDVLAGGGR